MGKAIELHVVGTAKKFKTVESFAIQGKSEVSGLEIHVFPRPFFDRLMSPSGKQADFVRMIKRSIDPSPPQHPIFLPNVQVLMARLVGDAFVSYYERHLDVVEARWEKEAKGKWPSVWKFAWAIRNACSHNGKIYIRNPNHPSLHWRNLKYDHNHNGRPILFDDLTGVELILLIEEMDAELRC